MDKLFGISITHDAEARHAAIAKGIWPFKHIVTGPTFLMLSKAEKHAVLMHEIGHCRNFHFEKRLLTVIFTFWIGFINADWWLKHIASKQARRHEIEADVYAARHGCAIELLSALSKLGKGKGLFHPDFEERRRVLLSFI